MRNTYDYIAPYYDSIVKLVFGNHILESQISFLDRLPNKGKILLIGGGTGKTLQKLVELKPLLHIDYVDASSKMIQKSKELLVNTAHNVTFIKGTEEVIPSINYDAILTFFFLDLFEQKKRKDIFHLLNNKLKPNGKWFVSDFNTPNNLYNKLLETTMFLFLKITTKIESNKIENYLDLFNQQGFKLNGRSEHFNNFIFSCIYQKQDGTIIG